MSEKKLEEIMSKDKNLVRRVSDIEVEEVTLTKKGALGDEADAVILYKEEGERSDDTKEDEAVDLEKGSDDSYKPTSGMVSEAKQGLEWRSEHGRGGTEVGIARARDISSGKELPLETVKRMHSFFSRHAVNKKGKGFTPGDGYPSNGRIAWALWGGDAGASWAAKIAGKETTEEASKSEAKLEKEEVAEDAMDGNIEMDFDSAISFIQKSELSDEQKQAVLDTALVMFDAVDLEKEESVPEPSGFPEEAMDLLKSIHGILEKEVPEQFKKKKKSDDDDEKSEESEDDKEDKKPEFLKKEEVSVVDTVEQLLRKSQEAKLAKEKADKEAAVHNKLNEMSSVLSGLTEKFTETQRRLNRECGIDA